MSIYSDRALAAEALKLSRKGMKGKAIAEAMKRDGVGTREANHLAAIGRAWAAIDADALTPSELLLIRCLAAIEREDLISGDIASTKGKWVSRRARKADGWAAATVRKRLGSHRAGEDEYRRGSGLNFVTASRNGHIWLTQAGWALVHAIEATEKAAA